MLHRPALLACLLVLGSAATGCGIPKRFYERERQAHGLVLVLPGIEGRSILNRNIAYGLYRGGVRSAIEVYDWTTGVPGSLLVNLTFQQRNEREAEDLARHISEYLDRYPGRPVQLIGHSGGGGIAVLALERLADDVEIEAAYLLAPALSPSYNLSRALAHTRVGIVNFYSRNDIGLLRVGTSVFGAIDRKHGAAAGAQGFDLPMNLEPEERRLYRSRLRQVRWTPQLRRYGASGTHVGWATQRFAQRYLSELVQRQEAAAALRRQDVAAQATVEPRDPEDSAPGRRDAEDPAAGQWREAADQ